MCMCVNSVNHFRDGMGHMETVKTVSGLNLAAPSSDSAILNTCLR